MDAAQMKAFVEMSERLEALGDLLSVLAGRPIE